MNIEKLISISESFDPITLLQFKKYLNENLYCEHCGCILYRNGKTKNEVQKYICSNCKKTVSERTGTVSCGSNL